MKHFLHLETDVKLKNIEPVSVKGFFRPVYTYEITDPGEYALAVKQLGHTPCSVISGGRI